MNPTTPANEDELHTILDDLIDQVVNDESGQMASRGVTKKDYPNHLQNLLAWHKTEVTKQVTEILERLMGQSKMRMRNPAIEEGAVGAYVEGVPTEAIQAELQRINSTNDSDSDK